MEATSVRHQWDIRSTKKNVSHLFPALLPVLVIWCCKKFGAACIALLQELLNHSFRAMPIDAVRWQRKQSGLSGGFTSPLTFAGRCEVEAWSSWLTLEMWIYRMPCHPVLRVWQTWKWRRLRWALKRTMFLIKVAPPGVPFQFASLAWRSGKLEGWEHANNLHSVMLGFIVYLFNTFSHIFIQHII